MFSKNLIIFISSVLFLIAGLGAGYYFGVSTGSKKVDVGNNCLGKTAGGIERSEIKTELTAREAYDMALSESRVWPKDTYLSGIELNSKRFDTSGLSNGWKVAFYSKEKNKTYEVTIKDGESRGTIEKDAAAPLQTLKGEMVDSSSLAKVFFGLYPADTEIISLRMYYDEGNKKFIWTIFFPKGSHTTDAEI